VIRKKVKHIYFKSFIDNADIINTHNYFTSYSEFFIILNVFKYIWCTIWIVKGMNSASVYLVINCLKWLSIGGLIFAGIVILQWLFGLVRIILEHDRFVHNL